MTEDNVVSRLVAFGEQPIDSGIASEHLTAIALVNSATAHPLRQKLQVAAALFAGLLIGSTGLAAAGALPDSAQEAAHVALAKVGFEVPPGHDRVTEGCDVDENGEHYKNHGQYVKAHKGDPAAAESDCGKPKRSVQNGGEVEGTSSDCANAAAKGDGAGAQGKAKAANAQAKTNAKSDAASANGQTKAANAGEGDGKAKGKTCDDEASTADDDAATEAEESGTVDSSGHENADPSPPTTTPAPEGTHGSAPGQPDETPVQTDPPANSQADEAPVPSTVPEDAPAE